MTDALDGNAAAGALADIFISEMTVARATCAKCGDTRPIGELRAYLRAPGIVLRCPTCDTAEIRIVRAEARPGSTSAASACSSSTSPRTGSVAGSPEDESVVLAPDVARKGPDAGPRRRHGLARLDSADSRRARRQRRAGPVRDLHVHQLAPDPPARPRVGGHVRRARTARRRRADAGVRDRARRRQRASRRTRAAPRVPDRDRQRLRDLGRIREPVLARAVPRRRRGPHPSRALR